MKKEEGMKDGGMEGKRGGRRRGKELEGQRKRRKVKRIIARKGWVGGPQVLKTIDRIGQIDLKKRTGLSSLS